MGKKVKTGFILLLILLTGFYVTTVLAGGSAEPGSMDDPVVTKSYVDKWMYLLQQSIQEMIGQQEQAGGVIAPIIVEELKAGDVLVGKAGTEIIVRTGQVTAYGEGSNGIPDVTAGVDIPIGQSIPLNHQLIIPRDDGRGIVVAARSQGISYVMVRGVYEVIPGN